ncbi:MAG: cell division protein FtsQ/DivIB [Bacteroidales bacterium]
MNKWKDIKGILKWALLIGYFVVIMGFVKKEHRLVVCKEINYEIDDRHKFVDTVDVYKLLVKDSLYPVGNKICNINLKQIEDLIVSNPAIQSAEVFLQLDGSMFIDVKQRNPVMRIITESNMHYYLDDHNTIMNTEFNYTADVPVLSGYFPDMLVMAFKQGNDSLKLREYNFTIRDIIEFLGFLYRDELWRNMIVQIYINDDHEFELVPRVGNHLIILGTLDDYAYKMKKLEALYKKAFSEFGWQNYKTINLKYSNQVVCSKI